jgi:hypothetical protein
VNGFRDQVTRHWHRALRRRSQRTRLNWERMLGARAGHRCPSLADGWYELV